MAEESGLSFGDIFAAVRKKFKFVLLATVLLAALFCIAVEYLYNPFASTYEIGFVLSYPADDTQKYPDGTPFYYGDIISKDALLDIVKTSGDERLSKIDVEALSDEDGITITPEIREVGNTLVETNRYTIGVKSSYFRSRELATAFLYAVARYPRKNVIKKAENLNFMLDETTFLAADFEERIDLLAQQRDSILAQYDEWIALYRESYSVSGTTFVNYRAKAEIAFSSGLENSLRKELETNGYVPVSELENRRAALQKEKKENEEKIKRLEEALGISSEPAFAPDDSVGDQFPDLSEMLASLYSRNVQIDSRLAALTKENVTAFEKRLKAVFDKMNVDRLDSAGAIIEESIATCVRAVGKGLYEEETRVTFDTSRVVRKGGIGLALNIICGILFGFLVSCIGACIAVLPSKRRKDGKKQTADAQGVQTEQGEQGEQGGDPQTDAVRESAEEDETKE